MSFPDIFARAVKKNRGSFNFDESRKKKEKKKKKKR
jgi:hypothetical protein